MAEFQQIRSIHTSKIGSVAGKATLSISVDGSSEVCNLWVVVYKLQNNWYFINILSRKSHDVDAII